MIDSIRPYLKLEYGLGLLLLIGVAGLYYLSTELGKVEDEKATVERQIVAAQEAQPASLDERDAVAQRLSQLSSELQVLEASVPDVGAAKVGTRSEALAVIGDLTDYITDREMDVASFNSEEVVLGGGEDEGEPTGRVIRYSLKVSGTAEELTGLLSLAEQTLNPGISDAVNPNAAIRELSFSRIEIPDAIWEITLVFDVPFV